jgi:hypothetical protein
MDFEQQMLDHLSKLIRWDRAYAAQQIPWYLKTCPWLEQAIGPQLREVWTSSRPSTSSTESGAAD